MAKKAIIIGGISTDPNIQTPYATGFKKMMPEYDFDEACFDNLIFAIKPDLFSIKVAESHVELSDYNLIIFRGRMRQESQLTYAICLYAIEKQIPFFNDYTSFRPSSKLAQTIFFYQQKAPFIDTYFCLNSEHLKLLINESLEFPFILKDNYGSHGNDNYLIKDETELDQILNSKQDVQYVAQRFHNNDGDYRILVCGDSRPLQILRRSLGDSHLNNTSQGGIGQLTNDVPDELIDISISLSHNLKMTVAGVDLLKDSTTNQYYFLEINSQPQLLTGALVEEKSEKVKTLIRQLLG